jgi:uncharacterized protein YcaQ
MMSIRLMVAGGTLGVCTVLAFLLGMGEGASDRTADVSRPVPPDVRALVAAMPEEAPATEVAAEKAALAEAVLAALARAEEPASDAAEPVAALSPADAPAFRLEAAPDWVAASGEAGPETELRPLPRRN